MAERLFSETGSDGRSVLGMLEVQMEKDPKTGVTTIRSLSPISTSAAPKTATIFDDGRKSIRAVGGAAAEPTTEELGQILNLIDGFGMKMLLDEIPITAKKVEKEERASLETTNTSGAKSLRFDTHASNTKEDNDRSRSNHGELSMEKSAVGVKNIDDTIIIRDLAEEVDQIEDERLKDGPVTLMFLGYTDALSSEAHGEQDGVIAVERVLITEDGEELVLGPHESSSLQPPLEKVNEKQGGEEVPRNGNETGGNILREEGSSSHIEADGKNPAKRKNCHCCSVM